LYSEGYDDSEDEEQEGPDQEEGMEFDSAEAPEPNFGFGASDSARPDFGRPDLEFFRYISASQYLPGIKGYIDNLKITERYKSSLTVAVTSLFSPETAFANNSIQKSTFSTINPIKVQNIDAKLILKKTIIDASKDDTLVVNPNSLTDAIYSVYLKYSSRSIGSKRERLIVTNMGTTMTSVSEVQSPEESVATPKKKSFWSFGGK
jgi:hypothetical protein